MRAVEKTAEARIGGSEEVTTYVDKLHSLIGLMVADINSGLLQLDGDAEFAKNEVELKAKIKELEEIHEHLKETPHIVFRRSVQDAGLDRPEVGEIE